MKARESAGQGGVREDEEDEEVEEIEEAEQPRPKRRRLDVGRRAAERPEAGNGNTGRRVKIEIELLSYMCMCINVEYM